MVSTSWEWQDGASFKLFVGFWFLGSWRFYNTMGAARPVEVVVEAKARFYRSTVGGRCRRKWCPARDSRAGARRVKE